MTSNIGSEYILENLPNQEELINQELHSTFKPEFLNRIDETIFFNSLNKDVVYKILDKIIKEIEYRLKDKSIKIELTKEAKDFIIDSSYDESFGARPIKRFVSDTLETMIAMDLINEKIKDNSTITVDVKNDKLYLN